MKTALLVIALGDKYRFFLDQLLESARRYFVPHTPVVWCDQPRGYPSGTMPFQESSYGFPEATLFRYRMFTEHAKDLARFDQLFYCDVDMTFVAPVVPEDVFSKGITATLHPGFVVQRRHGDGLFVHTTGTPERRSCSTAYIPEHSQNQYFCGGFNGGDSKTFLEMARILNKNIQEDSDHDVMAVWHDESHLNRYLYDNPPVKILTPSFCYPEDYAGQYGWLPETYPPVLLALDKRKKR